MRRIIGFGAALILLTTLGVATVAAQSSPNDDTARGSVQVINLVAVHVDNVDIDLGAPGPSVGDQFVFSDRLLRNGDEVGRDGGTCQVVHVEGATATSSASATGTPTTSAPTTSAPTTGTPTTSAPTTSSASPTATANCVVSLQLPRGQITVQGLATFTDSEPFTVAITGGTGAYRTAHGEIRVSPGDKEDRLRLTIIR